MFRYLVLAMLLTAPAHAGWFSYDNYEDCMLGRMKGQSQSMWSNADKLCKKQFAIEEEITFLANRMKRAWDYDRGELTIEISDNETDYVLTKGEFTFSEKPCEESKEADFKSPVTVSLLTRTTRTVMFMKPVCMKTLRLWGKYK